MGNETETNARQISAVSIPVTISGEDIHGQRFIESSTAFMVRRNGAVLDTIHQLAAEAALEVINMATNRKAAGRVKSLGPNLGPRQRILVEVEDREDFWVTQFGSDRRKPDIPEGVSAAAVTGTAPAGGQAEKAAEPLSNSPDTDRSGDSLSSSPDIPIASHVPPLDMHPGDREQQPLPASPSPYAPTETSKLNVPATDRLVQLLDELVRSALELNLRPAVDRMTSEIQQQAEQIARSVLVDLQEMIETSIVTSISRLRAQAAEVVSSQDQVLAQSAEELIHRAEQAISSRQGQGTSALLDRAQEIEGELARGLARQAGEATDRFSVELEARLNHALAAYSVALEKRLEAVENSFASRPKQWEEILTKQVAGRMQEIANGSLADLQRQLAETAATIRETFVEEIGGELKQVQDQLVRQTRQSAEDAAHQNLSRMRGEMLRLVKEMGEALEREADGIP